MEHLTLECPCGDVKIFVKRVPCSYCADDIINPCTHKAGLWQCPTCGEEVERWWL